MTTLPNEKPMPPTGENVDAGMEGFAAVVEYPDHKVIRDAVYKRVKGDCEKYSSDESAWGTPRHVVGQRYSDKFCKLVPKWNDFIDWINPLALEISLHINKCMSTGAAYDVEALRLYEYWGMLYKKGSQTAPHNHFPYALSFGYYINVPDESPPLIIGGEKLYPKEGEVVIFPASTIHSVPKSSVDDRVMIAGNFTYQPSRWKEYHPEPAGQTQETVSNMPPQMQMFSRKMRESGMAPGSVPSDMLEYMKKEGIQMGSPDSKKPIPKPPGFGYTQKKKKKGFTEL